MRNNPFLLEGRFALAGCRAGLGWAFFLCTAIQLLHIIDLLWSIAGLADVQGKLENSIRGDEDDSMSMDVLSQNTKNAGLAHLDDDAGKARAMGSQLLSACVQHSIPAILSTDLLWLIAGLAHARDELVNSILEDEDELIAAHRRQIEDTMAIVRLEMNLLAEVNSRDEFPVYPLFPSFSLSNQPAGCPFHPPPPRLPPWVRGRGVGAHGCEA